MKFIKNQLVGKDAVYAGDPKLQKEKRKFAVLSYDTADGEYSLVWDKLYNELKGAGVDVKGHVSYFLNCPPSRPTRQTIVQKLKAIDATTMIFTGDPIAPDLLHQEADAAEVLPRVGDVGHGLSPTPTCSRASSTRRSGSTRSVCR